LEEVKKLVPAALQDLQNDPEEEDEQAFLRKRIRKAVEGQQSIQQQLTALLDKIKEGTGGTTTTISNSKNVVTGNLKTRDGNIQIGDNNRQNNNSGGGTQNNYGDNYGTINIYQYQHPSPTNQATKPVTPAAVQDIRTLAGSGKIKPALESLLQLTSTADSDLHNQAILLASRWNRLKTDINMGVLAHNNAQIEQNRIVAALLGTLEDLH
jgi:hypothetical protein